MLAKLADKSWSLAQKIGTYLPFTYWRMVWTSIDNQAQSILDIGCADGDMMGFINNRGRFYTVGIDVYEPYLRKARKRNSHSENVLCDVRRLPFKERSFDTVLCLETLEHLDKKEEAMEAIKVLEEIARKQVIISTPVGFTKQQAYSGNPSQEHYLSLTPPELKRMGYKVKGIGISENWLTEKVRGALAKLADKRMAKVGDKEEKAESTSYALKFIDFLLRLPYYLIPGPFVYFLPRLGGHMICSKKIKA